MIEKAKRYYEEQIKGKYYKMGMGKLRDLIYY